MRPEPEANGPRRLPPVNDVLAQPALVEVAATRGRQTALDAVRRVLDESRDALRRGEDANTEAAALAQQAAELVDRDRPHLRPVINATGILVHTGLGRAPLAAEAIEAIARTAGGYCNLELDLETGERGRRTEGVAKLLTRLTSAEAATVVNNNAAATILALRALAAGREVIVSRGQLVEIGGSFRLPEIFQASGARLREVGTTNKTRLADYERAIGPETAALLRVHTSNYRIVGFTEHVELGDLARLARSRCVWLIDDIGSGALWPNSPPHVTGEPTVTGSLAAGADLVLFSGDKLLGGPQCGVLVGRKAVIGQITADPLMRAVRVDKLTLAALEATLWLMIDPDLARVRVPLWSLLAIPLDVLRARAARLAEAWRALGWNASVVDAAGFVGGGSVPLAQVSSVAVRIDPPFPANCGSEGAVARALRAGDPPVVVRVQDGAVLFDLRTIREEDEAGLHQTLRASCGR